jgi:polyisoprenoid-binding protein YceI
MQKFIVIGIAVVIAVGVAAWLSYSPDPTKGLDPVRANDPTDTTPTEVVDPAANVKTYAIVTDESSIDWEGSKPTETHIGGFAEFAGTVKVPDGNLEKAQVELTVQMDSLYSDAGGLTDVMKDPSFFDVATHPTSTFKTTGIAKGEKPDEYLVTGDFMLNGITKNITFPATITIEGDVLKTNAEFAVNRLDWNVVYQGLIPDEIIRDNALIRYDVVAKAQ